ncbi:MAG: porin [Candidatus Competibacteraceae bacterium]
MKKSVLTLAVAGALALPLAAQADTILYGSARVSVDYLQVEGDSSAWDVANNDSRLGVLGSEDLGGGLSAVYQYEFGVDVTEGTSGFENNRPKFVGLKGGFGTVTAGTQDTPYYNVAGIVDIFNSAKTFGNDAWLGGGFGEDQVGRGLAFTRLDNSIYYASPEFSGFSGEAMLVMDGRFNRAEGFSSGVDIWSIALKYEQGPFFAGLSYLALNDNFGQIPGISNLDLDQWVLGLGYTGGPFSVGFIYEQGKLNQYGFDTVLEGGDDATNFYLAGSYTFGNNAIRAAYGRLDPGTRGADEIDNFIVGYQYNFSRRTSLWAEYIGRSSDDLGDLNAVSLGTRVDF